MKIANCHLPSLPFGRYRPSFCALTKIRPAHAIKRILTAWRTFLNYATHPMGEQCHTKKNKILQLKRNLVGNLRYREQNQMHNDVMLYHDTLRKPFGYTFFHRLQSHRENFAFLYMHACLHTQFELQPMLVFWGANAICALNLNFIIKNWSN